MNQGRRWGLFLLGASIGMIFFAAYFNSKGSRCGWLPEARVLNDFRQKSIYFSPTIEQALAQKEIDTTSIKLILTYGTVDFGQSKTDTMPCRYYHVSGKKELAKTSLWVKNCGDYVQVEKILSNPRK